MASADGPEPPTPGSPPGTIPEATAARQPLSRGKVLFVLAPGVALAGALLGIPGSIIQEAFADPLVVFFAGPMIEEATKPAGLYLLLAFRPEYLTGRLQAAALASGAGAAFGLIESALYVSVYVEDPTPEYVAFRFTVPVALHVVASFIFGLGITPRLRASVAGTVPLLSGSWPFFVAAVVLHSGYNITVTVLEIFTEAFSSF